MLSEELFKFGPFGTYLHVENVLAHHVCFGVQGQPWQTRKRSAGDVCVRDVVRAVFAGGSADATILCLEVALLFGK